MTLTAYVTAYKPDRSAPQWGETVWMNACRELKASAEGERLGKAHAGDPWRLARALGADVERRPLAYLQEWHRRWKGTTDTMTILGNCLSVPGHPPVITLAQGLPAGREPDSELHTLAHELGHALELDSAGGDEGERACDAFATAFLAQVPEPEWMARAKAKQAWEDAAYARMGVRR